MGGGTDGSGQNTGATAGAGNSQNPFAQLANANVPGPGGAFFLPMQGLGAMLSGQNLQDWAQNVARQRGVLPQQQPVAPPPPAPYQNTPAQPYQNMQFGAPGSPVSGLLGFLSQLRQGQ
jgi:hypothetical protein